jgi:hypothetical protein
VADVVGDAVAVSESVGDLCSSGLVSRKPFSANAVGMYPSAERRWGRERVIYGRRAYIPARNLPTANSAGDR